MAVLWGLGWVLYVCGFVLFGGGWLVSFGLGGKFSRVSGVVVLRCRFFCLFCLVLGVDCGWALFGSKASVWDCRV